MRIMPGGALEADQESSALFVGRKLEEHRGAFLLEHPMDKGVVVDGGWDAMERLWEVRTTVTIEYYLCDHLITSLTAPFGSIRLCALCACLTMRIVACLFETMSEC